MNQDQNLAGEMKRGDSPDVQNIKQDNNSAGKLKEEEVYDSIKEIKQHSPDVQNVNQDIHPVTENLNQDNNSAGEMKHEEVYEFINEIKQDSSDAQNMNQDIHPVRENMNQDNYPANSMERGESYIIIEEVKVVPLESQMWWCCTVDCWLVVINICLIWIAIGKISFYGEFLRATSYSLTYIIGFGSVTFYLVGAILFSVGACMLQSWGCNCAKDSDENRNQGIRILNRAWFILIWYFFLEVIINAITIFVAFNLFVLIGDIIWTIFNGIIFLYLIPMLIALRRGYNPSWTQATKIVIFRKI